MRAYFLLPLVLAACSEGDGAADPALGNWRGEGRDRLCIASGDNGLRAGFVTYGAGDSNCTAAGPVARGGAGFVLAPSGDPDCRIAIRLDGATIRLGPRGPACAYYCGPAADYSGRRFRRDAGGGGASDLAGDPLC